MAQVETHRCKTSITDSTTNTTWTAIGSTDGVDLIAGSNLSPDTKYLVIARGRLGADTTTGHAGIRVATDDDSTIATKSEMRIEPAIAAFSSYEKDWFYVGSYTTDASSPSDIGIEFIAHDGDTVIAGSTIVTLINLDDIGTSNYIEASDSGGGGYFTGTWGGLHVGIAGSSLSADTEYLVLGCAQTVVDDNKTNFHQRLIGDTNGNGSVEQMTYASEEGEDSAEIRLIGHMGRVLTGSSIVNSIEIEHYADAANDYTEGYSYLIAIDVSFFDEFEYAYSATGETLSTTESVIHATSTVQPSTATNYLYLSRYNYTVAGNTGRVTNAVYAYLEGRGHVQDGNNYGTYGWDPTDAESINSHGIEEFGTSAQVVQIRAKYYSSDSAPTSEYEFVAALSMAEASTGNAYTDNLDAALNHTCTQDDSADFLDNRSAAIQAGVDSTDNLAALDDNRSAAVEFGVAVTEGLGYTDAATAAIELTTASTDQFAALDSRTAATELTGTQNDQAAMLDNRAAAAELATSSFDGQGYSDSASAAIELGVDSTDVHTPAGIEYDETGRIASIELTVDSTDDAGFLDAVAAAIELAVATTDDLAALNSATAAAELATASSDALAVTEALAAAAELSTSSSETFAALEALAAATELSTASSDNTAMLDNRAADTEFGADSTDVYTGGGTNYDETGRSAAVELSTASSDNSAALDSRSGAVEVSTASTDGQSYTDAATAAVEVSTASTDGQGYTDNLAAATELGVASTDNQAATDSATAAIEVAVDTSDVWAALDNLATAVELNSGGTDFLTGAFDILEVQNNTGASSASGFTATYDTAPTAGNLLVIVTAGGDTVSLNNEPTWAEAHSDDGDRVVIWWKIADGDATDNNVDFSMPGSDQYGWVAVEYSATDDWLASPVDVGAHTNSQSGGDTSIASGTTATTTQNDELAIAGFRLREGSEAISGDSLTYSFSKVASDGTQYGQPWALEIYVADKVLETTGTQASTLSWTNGDRSNRVGAIVTFKADRHAAYEDLERTAAIAVDGVVDDAAGYSESLAASIQTTTASSDVAALIDQRSADVELEVQSTDIFTGETAYQELDLVAGVELATDSTDIGPGYESLAAAVGLSTAETDTSAQVAATALAAVEVAGIANELIRPTAASGTGTVAGSTTGRPSVARTLGAPSVSLPPGGSPSAPGARGTPRVSPEEDY